MEENEEVEKEVEREKGREAWGGLPRVLKRGKGRGGKERVDPEQEDAAAAPAPAAASLARRGVQRTDGLEDSNRPSKVRRRPLPSVFSDSEDEFAAAHPAPTATPPPPATVPSALAVVPLAPAEGKRVFSISHISLY